MKKITAMIAAVLMVLVMSVPAFGFPFPGLGATGGEFPGKGATAGEFPGIGKGPCYLPPQASERAHAAKAQYNPHCGVE